MPFKSISGKVALPNGTKIKYDMEPKLINAGSEIPEVDTIHDTTGTRTEDASVLRGTGKIVGIGSELPVLGFMYIIETDIRISDEYPYTAFICPEVYIEQIETNK